MVNKLQSVTITGTIPAAGTGVIAYSDPIRGWIESVEVDYPAHACTVDIDSYASTVTQTILDLASASTDAVYYPRTPLHTYTGAAIDLSDAEGGDTAMYGRFAITGKLKLTVASGTAEETVTVKINYEEY